MTEIHFTNLLIVVAAAFAAPFLLGLAPRGAAALGGAGDRRRDSDWPRGARLGRDRRPDRGPEPDRARVPALPPGLEIDFGRLRGPLLQLSALSYANRDRPRRVRRRDGDADRTRVGEAQPPPVCGGSPSYAGGYTGP